MHPFLSIESFSALVLCKSIKIVDELTFFTFRIASELKSRDVFAFLLILLVSDVFLKTYFRQVYRSSQLGYGSSYGLET